MTSGCCSTLITRASSLVPPLSQQLKVLIILRHHRNTALCCFPRSDNSIYTYSYLGACSEPVSLDSACNAVRCFVTAISTKPH